MFEQSHEAWMNYLLFRDYLRAHPTIAQTYGTLKRQLAAQFAHDRVAMILGIGGMGKTALAVTLARRLKEQFDCGYLFKLVRLAAVI
jgi:GrpB-like predicted nucleotidyltransferase (UPF0157 family)